MAEEMSSNHHTPADNDAPLPLSELCDRVTEETFKWLQDEEIDSVEEDEAAATAVSLFEQYDDENEAYSRVQTWTSSSQTPDGFGGYFVARENHSCGATSAEEKVVNEENGNATTTASSENHQVTVQYILSDASGGHGDDLWAASRHIANLLADPPKCRELLHRQEQCETTACSENEPHPLLGLKLVELGAGGGVPSWTAMWCGARVVCTDQEISDRIRCLAECAERNIRAMSSSRNTSVDQQTLAFAMEAKVCPYNWGSPADKVTSALAGDIECRFDVVVASDCIYMPEYHSVLLESIQALLADDGVALLPFALHGNTKDDNVWGIIELAKTKNFSVEVLDSQQLTPQASGMDKKRALVHMLRLTKR